MVELVLIHTKLSYSLGYAV